MKETNPKDPTFYNATHDINEFPNFRRPILTTEGMTKRELFAIKALQGLLSDSVNISAVVKIARIEEVTAKRLLAMMAVEYADALIQKLNEGKENKND